jgi:hypothetical protein
VLEGHYYEYTARGKATRLYNLDTKKKALINAMWVIHTRFNLTPVKEGVWRVEEDLDDGLLEISGKTDD